MFNVKLIKEEDGCFSQIFWFIRNINFTKDSLYYIKTLISTLENTKRRVIFLNVIKKRPKRESYEQAEEQTEQIIDAKQRYQK